MTGPRPHPNLWYPFTPVGSMATPLRVLRGEGSLLHLEDGRTLIDCISSWWVNLHGHGEPRIARAIHDQALTLEHVLFAGFTHRPAEELAERLVPHLPGALDRIFYSDDGSTAVEVALKIAAQFWRNRGRPRTAFLAFEGAYHGDTFGAMAVGSRSLFTAPFDSLLFEVEHLPFPERWLGDDEGGDQREEVVLREVERRLSEGPERYAGVLIEPLVQGAGGMRICSESFLRRLAQIVRKGGSLLLVDEVMTGFGRTGEWFASTRAGIEPDILCAAKGITGGFLPLAVTAVGEEVFGAFRGSDPDQALWHGHSYTANPIGCAAALASLTLLEEKEGAFRGMEAHHLRFLASLDPERTHRPRAIGTIAAFDLRTDGEPGYLHPSGRILRERALERGLLLRPLGPTVYLMPPYSLTDAERDRVYQTLLELIAD